MKRRIDSMKLRRAGGGGGGGGSSRKFNYSNGKIYDGIYVSIVVYIKLILLWICIMGGDFILEFRLEYLYPIYLLLHNSYEAYKFQGVAFALLLLCIVISVDVICVGLIPPPWLFLLGSLAVWAQISWNLTPVGPFFILPILIYIDGKIITNTSRFGEEDGEEGGGGGQGGMVAGGPLAAHCLGFPLVSLGFGLKSLICQRIKSRTRSDVSRQNEFLYSILWEALPFTTTSPTPVVLQPIIEQQVVIKKSTTVVQRRRSVENLVEEGHHQNNNHHGVVGGVGVGGGVNGACNGCVVGVVGGVGGKKKKEDCCLKLESDLRKLRSDLHFAKTLESDLRGQIHSHSSSERNLRADLGSLQSEHEALQTKFNALLARCQEDKIMAEKRVAEERRAKEAAVNRQKKASADCPGDCKRKLRELEREKETLKRDLKLYEEKMSRVERELQNVKSTLLHEQKSKEPSTSNSPSPDTTRLVSLLTALQDQNAHLESSLSAETKLKLDLFSALGEARRQLAIKDTTIKQTESELDDLRAQLMSTIYGSPQLPSSNGTPCIKLHNLGINLGTSIVPENNNQMNSYINGGGHESK